MAEHVVAVRSPEVAWSTPGAALHLLVQRTTLRRTLLIALIVGTILSLVNQASVFFGGGPTLATWLRVGANFVVPFCVSSAGFLAATRGRAP